MLAWYLLQSFDYAVKRYYNADELRYGHAAWLVAKGFRPYVDFWDIKFPFIYQFMSLIFTFTDDHPGNILYLRIIMFMMLCITSISVYKINRKSNGAWAILAPVMLLSVWSYVFMAIEIQPDGMATALYFASIAILYVTGMSAAVRGFLIRYIIHSMFMDFPEGILLWNDLPDCIYNRYIYQLQNKKRVSSRQPGIFLTWFFNSAGGDILLSCINRHTCCPLSKLHKGVVFL